MPRGPRLDFAGALHHVIVRGSKRRRIFRGDADRQLFLNRLADWVIDSRAGLYAWALMPNHILCAAAHNAWVVMSVQASEIVPIVRYVPRSVP